jgi:hypothetical protein
VYEYKNDMHLSCALKTVVNEPDGFVKNWSRDFQRL